VDQNPSSQMRSGQITVAGQQLTINQFGIACKISATVSNSSFDATGGSGLLSVTATPEDCTWTAVPSDSWISLPGASSGTGSMDLSFSIASNANPSARNGSITVAGHSVSLTQAGKPVILTIATNGTG